MVLGIAAGALYPAVQALHVRRVAEADIGAYNGLNSVVNVSCSVFAGSVFMSRGWLAQLRTTSSFRSHWDSQWWPCC